MKKIKKTTKQAVKAVDNILTMLDSAFILIRDNRERIEALEKVQEEDHEDISGLLDGWKIEHRKPVHEEFCTHCHCPISTRNPSGYCDHLYYPENCKVCSGKDTGVRAKIRAMIGIHEQGVDGLDSLELTDQILSLIKENYE